MEWQTVEVTMEGKSNSYKKLTDWILVRRALSVSFFQDGWLLNKMHHQWEYPVKEGKGSLPHGRASSPLNMKKKTTMDTQELKNEKWKLLTCKEIKKLSMVLSPCEAKSWITKAFKFLQSGKSSLTELAGFLTRKTKTATASTPGTFR